MKTVGDEIDDFVALLETVDSGTRVNACEIEAKEQAEMMMCVCNGVNRLILRR